MSGQTTGTGRTAALFLLLAAMGMAMAVYVLPDGPVTSREAVVRGGVARDLLVGLSRGRQGLIGSAHWAPLPTLLALPFFRMPKPFGGEWSFLLLSVAGAAAVGTTLYRWSRRHGAPAAAAFAATMGVFLSPAVRQAALSASSDILFAALMGGALCFLLHWIETRHLRSLAYLAVALMLAAMTRYQGALPALLALGIVGAALLMRSRPKHYLEATLVVLLAPPAYALLLWAGANWLIMGEPGFFARGLWGAFGAAMAEGCDWRLVAAVLAAVLAIWIVGRAEMRRRALRGGAAAIAVAALFWIPMFSVPNGMDPAGQELRYEVMPFARAQYPDDWIVISGYRGYEALADAPEGPSETVQHMLSFYLAPVLRDTHDRRTFLLAPKPEGPDRWEDINLKFPRLYEDGSVFTVYERSWRHWRLWRVVRLDATDRK